MDTKLDLDVNLIVGCVFLNPHSLISFCLSTYKEVCQVWFVN